jgi:hypothetical protein
MIPNDPLNVGMVKICMLCLRLEEILWHGEARHICRDNVWHNMPTNGTLNLDWHPQANLWTLTFRNSTGQPITIFHNKLFRILHETPVVRQDAKVDGVWLVGHLAPATKSPS